MKNKILQHVINNVELEILNYKCDYVGIKRAKSNGYYFLNDKLYITYEGGSTGKSLVDCKPILSPLSDLKNNIGADKNSVTYAAYLKLWVAADIDFVINMPLSCDYFTVQKMLEWHFDVFGLIEKGLAIDKNILIEDAINKEVNNFSDRFHPED